MYNLLYDETYDLESVYKLTKNNIYSDKDWVEISNYDDFMVHILKNGLPELISFGHDIIDNADDKSYYHKFYKSGYDCVLWLFTHCKNNNLEFPNYIIHSNSINSSIRDLLENSNI